MMTDGLQNIFVWAVVAVAVSYLAWSGWQTFVRRGANGCGGCGNAGQIDAGEGTDRAPQVKPFVSIEDVKIAFGPGRQAGENKDKEKP